MYHRYLRYKVSIGGHHIPEGSYNPLAPLLEAEGGYFLVLLAISYRPNIHIGFFKNHRCPQRGYPIYRGKPTRLLYFYVDGPAPVREIPFVLQLPPLQVPSGSTGYDSSIVERGTAYIKVSNTVDAYGTLSILFNTVCGVPLVPALVVYGRGGAAIGLL